ncbi:hypothetical protein ACLOJK_005675 [Asimina triloba]
MEMTKAEVQWDRAYAEAKVPHSEVSRRPGACPECGHLGEGCNGSEKSLRSGGESLQARGQEMATTLEAQDKVELPCGRPLVHGGAIDYGTTMNVVNDFQRLCVSITDWLNVKSRDHLSHSTNRLDEQAILLGMPLLCLFDKDVARDNIVEFINSAGKSETEFLIKLVIVNVLDEGKHRSVSCSKLTKEPRAREIDHIFPDSDLSRMARKAQPLRGFDVEDGREWDKKKSFSQTALNNEVKNNANAEERLQSGSVGDGGRGLTRDLQRENKKESIINK